MVFVWKDFKHLDLRFGVEYIRSIQLLFSTFLHFKWFFNLKFISKFHKVSFLKVSKKASQMKKYLSFKLNIKWWILQVSCTVPPMMDPFDMPQKISATQPPRSIELYLPLRLRNFFLAMLD